ncbi:hypothetical protein M011DRAFT_472828 [Sporormia fimetaria CBS 119925]|uniref:Uncharacterized protein n=1 Tax=Sporormia fimetaria CBS 119925 TaxID=1340428 RepID=A0A6A6UWD9_9PLEO|nr:hypothetical protein M011DRAFT_472828 [Sporormia fimetaria CBS 119925]
MCLAWVTLLFNGSPPLLSRIARNVSFAVLSLSRSDGSGARRAYICCPASAHFLPPHLHSNSNSSKINNMEINNPFEVHTGDGGGHQEQHDQAHCQDPAHQDQQHDQNTEQDRTMNDQAPDDVQVHQDQPSMNDTDPPQNPEEQERRRLHDERQRARQEASRLRDAASHQLHQELADGRTAGRYWSITTMPMPYSPWSPLFSHREKETRPCHSAWSRVHKLTCGHFVAVEGGAEQCAANCVGMNLPAIAQAHKAKPVLKHGEILADGKTPGEVVDDKMNALTVYGSTFLVAKGEPGMKTAMDLLNSLAQTNFIHQHRPANNKGGKFACQECKSEGQRPSVPTFHYRRTPWQVVIPIRDEESLAVVQRLKSGVVPKPPRPHVYHHRRGPQNDRVRAARITRHRVQEKKTVLKKIAEETIIETIKDMKLFQID